MTTMSISFEGDDFSSISDAIREEAANGAHEAAAEKVAEIARENGLKSADDIDINTNDFGYPIDAERVRREANDILSQD